MCVLSGFKAMVEEEPANDVVVFRTSRVGLVLGVLFILAGVGIVSQVLASKFFASSIGFCVFSLLISGFFICVGAVLAAYGKKVLVDFAESKINLLESSIYGLRSKSFHFDDIMSVEVSRDSKCLLSQHASLWVVKVFLANGSSDFAVEKIFASTSAFETKDVAETIAFKIGKRPFFSCQASEMLMLGQA